MKKILLISLLFCFISQAFSQRFKEIVKWKIITNNGGVVLGASPNEHMADSIINDFAFRNKDLQYSAQHTQKLHTSLKVKNRKDNPIQDLIDGTKSGYIVLSPKQALIVNSHEKKYIIDLAFALTKDMDIGISDAIDKAKIIRKYWIPSDLKKITKIRIINLNKNVITVSN